MAQLSRGTSGMTRQWVATGVVTAALVGVITAVSVTVPRDGVSVAASGASGISVTATDNSCAADVRPTTTGPAVFTVHNASQWPQEVYLVKLPEKGSVARTIVLGPGNEVALRAILGPGKYGFQCLQSGHLVSSSPAFDVTGPTPANVTPAIAQASTGELQQANGLYIKYVQHVLANLQGQAATLQKSLASGDTARAKADLLTAQQSWARVGAAYDSFGDLGQAIAGSSDASVAPEKDPGFSGLGRIEYGLYHGEAPQSLAGMAEAVQSDVTDLARQAPTLALAKGSLGLRAHEILEDSLRDRLSGQDDQGSGMAFAITLADVDATRTAVGDLQAVLDARKPGLVTTINAELDSVAKALETMHSNDGWTRISDSTLAQRQPINSSVSAVLETLAQVPQLLVLPQGSE
jgi:high-affinity iron transporter